MSFRVIQQPVSLIFHDERIHLSYRSFWLRFSIIFQRQLCLLTGCRRGITITRVFLVGPVFSISFVTVPSYLQRITAVLMCTSAAFGHALGWLHVSLCVDCELVACVSEMVAVPSGCDGCCKHGHEPTSRTTETPAPVPHDSDSCVICQSLGCPVGRPFTPSALTSTGDAQHFIKVQRCPHECILRVAPSRSRGPPMPVS